MKEFESVVVSAFECSCLQGRKLTKRKVQGLFIGPWPALEEKKGLTLDIVQRRIRRHEIVLVANRVFTYPQENNLTLRFSFAGRWNEDFFNNMGLLKERRTMKQFK